MEYNLPPQIQGLTDKEVIESRKIHGTNEAVKTDN